MFQSRYYVFNIIAPVTLVLFITLGVFWLPPGCGEKISLGITVLLSYSVMQVVIMDITPVNSKDTPLVGKYITQRKFTKKNTLLIEHVKLVNSCG